jgi:membrane-associated phospholipid phosphatase
MKYLDLLGFYGPAILGMLNLLCLWSHRYYFSTFIVGYIGSVLLNGFLKHIIREPRPTNQRHINEYDNPNHADRFGMPSGHAQLTGYAVTFLYLVVRNPCLLVVSIFIGALTIFQRYAYRRHTATQLVAGLTVGAITAYMLYEYTKSQLEN